MLHIEDSLKLNKHHMSCLLLFHHAYYLLYSSHFTVNSLALLGLLRINIINSSYEFELFSTLEIICALIYPHMHKYIF